MHFGITESEKPTTDCLSLCNNVSDVNKANSVKAKAKASQDQGLIVQGKGQGLTFLGQGQGQGLTLQGRIFEYDGIKSSHVHTVIIIISINSNYCQLHGKIYCKSVRCISERQALPTVHLAF